LADNNVEFIFICPGCELPTYYNLRSNQQVPGPPYGNDVEHVPDEVYKLYNEARACMTVSAFTPAVLACRKLLMHIAVSKGAAEGQSFFSYVEYLSNQGYVPPDGRGWVDYIRTRSNEANHEIVLMGRDDVERLIAFSEMLLKFVFEFPAQVASPGTP
jgi:hypothetical protein